MEKTPFRKEQARKLALLAFLMSLFIMAIIVIKGGFEMMLILWLAGMTIGAYVIGGYHDPDNLDNNCD